jgi:hypothetical protein
MDACNAMRFGSYSDFNAAEKYLLPKFFRRIKRKLIFKKWIALTL